MARLLLASSDRNGIVLKKGRLFSRQVGRPDREIKVTDQKTFLEAAEAKWGLRRVLDAKVPDSSSGVFPIRLHRLESGEIVYEGKS